MDLRELHVVRASLVASLATVEALIARATEGSGAACATVTLDEHMQRTGQNRRQGRATFAAFERAGFAVTRLGRACSMDAAEYARAVAAVSSKRSKPSRSDGPREDQSPAALLERSGLSGGAPKKRAA